MDILRISTAGSVDDGKSTLIGRLLFETGSLKYDQLENIKNISKTRGSDYLDFSLATDGLLTEREQGITIDVSHIYFSTKNRRFIIADSPGHEEYTRNMITGASNSKLAIILLDAKKGITQQTKRHFFIAQLLNIKNIIIAINKIDLIFYSEKIYKKIIKNFFNSFKLNIHNLVIKFIPISALKGDNIINSSINTPWYNGESLLKILESIKIENIIYNESLLQVQLIIRPRIKKFYNYRGFAGKLKSGTLKIGEKIKILPSGRESKIRSIEKYGKKKEILFQNENGVLLLEDELDISREDTIIGIKYPIISSERIICNICWMQFKLLECKTRIIIQHGIHRVVGMIHKIFNKINLDNLDFLETNQLNFNDIGLVEIHLSNPIFYISYNKNPYLGVFILIDEITNNTAGVGFLK